MTTEELEHTLGFTQQQLQRVAATPDGLDKLLSYAIEIGRNMGLVQGTKLANHAMKSYAQQVLANNLHTDEEELCQTS